MVELALEKEYTDLYYRYNQKSYLGLFPFIGILYYVYSDYVALEFLLICFSLMVALTITQLLLTTNYFKSNITTINDCKRWQVYSAVCSLIVNCCIAGIASFGGRLPISESFLITLTLVACIASYSASGFTKLVLVSAIPLLSAVVISNRENLGEYWRLSFVIVFLACLFFYMMSSYFEKTLRDSIRIRFENTELLQELKIKKAEADLANDAKSKFLAAASHDLRQPLHALGMYMDTLKSLLTNENQQVLSSKIDLSLDALNSLFDSLLDISKLDSKTINPVVENFNVKNVLLRISDNFQEFAAQKNIKLILKVNPEVIQSDKVLLERVISNLISNAIRYTNEGSVTIETITKNEDVFIRVIDTGIGIPSNELKNIFDEFYQLDNPERNQTKGMGLGLSIVRRLVDLLGHEMNFTSRENVGTSVELKLPRGKIDSNTLQNQNDHVYDIAGLKVLFLDDNEAILESMKLLLERWGCEAFTYRNIETALKHAEQNAVPDIIISDNNLENSLTGSEAIERLTSNLDAEIPAILVTGDTSSERILDATQKGYELLHKPVNPGVLKKRIALITTPKAINSNRS